MSTHVASRRIGISRNALGKHIRRGTIVPDFVSDKGSFFAADRIPQLKKAIAENRQRQWRHVAA